jgi:hypothetical protein
VDRDAGWTSRRGGRDAKRMSTLGMSKSVLFKIERETILFIVLKNVNMYLVKKLQYRTYFTTTANAVVVKYMC